MSRSERPGPGDITRFHDAATDGDLERLRAALAAGIDVDTPGHCGATALMRALEAKHLPIAKFLIEQGADPELTDDFNATALKHAVEADFANGVRFLLSLGVDRGYEPRYPLKKVAFDPDLLPSTEMPPEYEGLLSREEWADVARDIVGFGENPTVEPIIASVQSVEMLELFLAAGDDVNLAPQEVKRAWVGLSTGGELSVSPSEYETNKAPRFGAGNPERMDVAFWKDMIRTGGNAYAARTHYQDQDPYPFSTPIWCYDRFGSTITRLGHGRFVQIGGEHEDFYDPDFFIYNDVVIHDGRGGVEIYGYPRDVFPPTDHHSATLCPDGIYLIGCLGYLDDRQAGHTPVYRLELDSWRITAIATAGEMPGWIHRHWAAFDPDRGTISIGGGQVHVVQEGEGNLASNEHEFVLELASCAWRRVNR